MQSYKTLLADLQKDANFLHDLPVIGFEIGFLCLRSSFESSIAISVTREALLAFCFSLSAITVNYLI